MNNRVRLGRPPQCQKDLYPPDPRYSRSPLRAIEYSEHDSLSVPYTSTLSSRRVQSRGVSSGGRGPRRGSTHPLAQRGPAPETGGV